MSQQESPEKSSETEEDRAQAGNEERPQEYGGPKGKEPTRYGDWEKNGRCIDF